MLNNFKVIAVGLGSLCISFVAAANEYEDQVVIAQKIIGQFQSTLSSKLQTAMQTGGPTNAIEVCASEAQIIAQSISKEFGVMVKRVSNKPRNELDAPSLIDQAVLTQFEEKAKNETNGTTKDPKNYVSKKEADDKDLIYHQAIFIQPACLICHGENIAPNVSAKINEFYPNDLATGYKLGELRGAFVVEF